MGTWCIRSKYPGSPAGCFSEAFCGRLFRFSSLWCSLRWLYSCSLAICFQEPFDVVLLSIFRVATCICVSIVIMISHSVSLWFVVEAKRWEQSEPSQIPFGRDWTSSHMFGGSNWVCLESNDLSLQRRTDYYISNCELRDGSWVSKVPSRVVMSLFTFGMEAGVYRKDNLDNFLGHYTSARFSTCMSSAINAQPMQAMYLPSQVHGNLLRFMFGIEVGIGGTSVAQRCVIHRCFIVKQLCRNIQNCPL